MTEELKPCPFCGSSYIFLYGRMMPYAILHDKEGYKTAVVFCNDCGAMTHRAVKNEGCCEYAEKSSIALWNRRVNDE